MEKNWSYKWRQMGVSFGKRFIWKWSLLRSYKRKSCAKAKL